MALPPRYQRGCRNPTRGVLLGCHLHKWEKLLTRLHFTASPAVRERVAHHVATYPPAGMSLSTSGAGVSVAGPIRVQVESSPKDRVVFCCTLVSAVTGVGSFVAAVAVLHQ